MADSITVDIDTQSVPIAAPESWMSTYIGLRERAIARSKERFDLIFFLKIPREVRAVIYTYVLASERPVLPHLCDSNSSSVPKFHDDNNNADHASLFKLTSITRASKELREESLPFFYAANSFAIGTDTATYFAYLQSLDRLEWILNVDLVLRSGPADRAAWILRCANQFDIEARRHEKNNSNAAMNPDIPLNHLRNHAPRPEATAIGIHGSIARKALRTHNLTLHPRYNVGGFSDLNLAILLRQLSTAAPPDITLPAPARAPRVKLPRIQSQHEPSLVLSARPRSRNGVGVRGAR